MGVWDKQQTYRLLKEGLMKSKGKTVWGSYDKRENRGKEYQINEVAKGWGVRGLP